MSQISDELLVAYLDGQLDTPQARSLERMVRASEELRARAERLKRTQAYLVQTFETLARRTRSFALPAGHAREDRRAGSPAQTMSREGVADRPGTAGAAEQDGAASPRSSVGRKLVWTVAVATMAAVLGYGAAQWLRAQDAGGPQKISARVPAPAGRWAEDVARLHAHFLPTSVSADPESQTNRDLVQLQLSRVASTAVSVPDFAQHGLVFRRGQVLSYRGSRMMQLSYTNADDQLVALYIMPGGPSARATAMTQGDVTAVNWSRDGVRYVIAGEIAETSLRALAAVAMAQVAGR